ncbi:MAG: bifunctional helix-turn-helix transcriptional regulator/GNAT family N-acetyltransferase [Candidatus Hodarchaeales archaeon]|jgi:DNA-binding MarR family transcriptional regulator/GNAT superfamily N-acetyltransferase
MEAATKDRIAEIREFNRFYTRIIGVLRKGLLHSPFSLTEARIIFELAHKKELTATDLCRDLGLDQGYLSRILVRLEKQDVLQKVKSQKDGRQRILSLTPKGEKEFELLNTRASDEVADILQRLTESDQLRLIKAMKTIASILDEGFKYSEPFFLRTHHSGDMGWVTYRHGVIYSQEYGWNEEFEALVSQIVADFIKNYNPTRERCWIAEMHGEPVGSVFLVQDPEDVATAKLRLLLVEPRARGLGLGTRLVEECVRFSKECGYQKIVLWTNDVLVDARSIYIKKGFNLIDQEKHHSFGHDLIGEYWELIL